MVLLLLLLLAFAAAPVIADPFPAAPHVYVEGSAEVRLEPDTLQLWVAIEATNPQLATAKASVDERARKLIESCKRLGIEDDDITSASLEFGPAYDDRSSERKFLGTKVQREIDVTLRKLDRYSELVQAIVASQVGRITSTTMSSSKGAMVLEEAQQKALADARARAERLAAASGQAVGAAYSISEFDMRQGEQYQLLRPMRDVGKRPARGESIISFSSGESSEPFEPGTIVARATVYVIYLLAPK
jgi:uncharacterized protein